MSKQHLADLGSIIEDLEAMGRLVRVRTVVDPDHELAGIAARFEDGARAVLFEKVKGYDHPIFTGLYWSRELLGALMRMPERELPGFVSASIKKWQREPIDPVVVETGPVLEVTEPEVDLYRLPVPTHALADGGRYFDAAVVITRDPETGVRNASIQRFMIVDKDTMGVNIDAGRHLELYLEKAARQRRNLPFTINVGVGPGLHFAASSPAEAAPADRDEIGIASEFTGRPVELVRSRHSDVEMLANAMYALECELLWDEQQMEGPFAEVTGYYAMAAPRGKVKVKAIHHRHKPVFQTILPGKEVFNSVGLLGEANVLNLLQMQVPGVKDVYFNHGGCGFYGAVVQIDQKRAGWARQAILATFAAFPPLKIVTVVDDDVDIRSASDVEWAMTTRLDPRHGIIVLNDIFGHGLNPSFPNYLGNKVGFDATQPYPRRPEYMRAAVMEVALDRYEIAMPDIVQPEMRLTASSASAAPKGQSLLEYILEKTGAQSGGAQAGGVQADGAQSAQSGGPAASSNANSRGNGHTASGGGGSLLEYILQKTGAAQAGGGDCSARGAASTATAARTTAKGGGNGPLTSM